MNKTQLIARIAGDHRLTKAKAGQFVDALVEAIGDSLALGASLGGTGSVVLPNFGGFHAGQRRPRAGTNPSTGAKLTIPARWVVVFRPGAGLKAWLQAGA